MYHYFLYSDSLVPGTIKPKNSWDGYVKDHFVKRNEQKEVTVVLLMLEEFPDKKFFVPKKIALNKLILEKGPVVYGLKPTKKIKVIGK